MNAPFASGSNPPDAMVVIPCTMGTMGRIAHGYSEDVLLRAADVVLKERKKLILVPRETPLSLVHVKNMELLLLAGATFCRRIPVFIPARERSRRGGHRGCARARPSRRPRRTNSRRAGRKKAGMISEKLPNSRSGDSKKWGRWARLIQRKSSHCCLY
jgi:hypothetical protein